MFQISTNQNTETLLHDTNTVMTLVLVASLFTCMKISFISNIYFIPLILTFAHLLRRVRSVMSLQLPGLNYGTGEPTTVEIEFLDSSNNPIYTLKGEVFVQSLPMQANSMFIPDKLTGTQKFVHKIRIKAGESGMVLKLFDSPTASVPKLIVLMKEGFLMTNNEPIEIDVMNGDNHQTIKQAEINWYNRDLAEMTRQRGLHVGKLELHVERIENAPLQPIYKFGMISSPQNNLLIPETMMAGVKGVSMLPSPNAVYMAPPASSSPNVFFNVAPPMAAAAPQPPQQQYPNAPPFAGGSVL